MHREGEEVHVNDEEATGATKEKHLRYILAISLLLAVIAMSAVWIIPSLIG